MMATPGVMPGVTLLIVANPAPTGTIGSQLPSEPGAVAGGA